MSDARAYSERIGERLIAARRRLCSDWLEEIRVDLPADLEGDGPIESVLGDVPRFLAAIGESLAGPRGKPLAASAGVLVELRELGRQRHAQGVSLQQVLREYQALWRALVDFVEDESRRLDPPPDFFDCRAVLGQLHDALDLLVRFTVDAYVERLTTALEEQGERLLGFNEAVSHELRNPMHTLRLAAEVLDTEDAEGGSPARARAIGTVRNSLERMSTTLGRLQEISRTARPEAPTPARAGQVRLTPVVDDVARWLADLAEERGVELRLSLRQRRARVQEGRLLIALLNVVTNSMLYSDPDKPERFVEISTLAEDGDLRVEVVDNGLGIPEADLRRLREASVGPGSGDGSAHPPSAGPQAHGVGLALTRECVVEMGGTLAIDSIFGSGTTVTMTFFGAVAEPR